MLIRDYNAETDYDGLRACVVALQDFEYEIDGRFPDGESIVDVYIPDVLRRCEEYAGKIMVADVDGTIAGYIMVWTRHVTGDVEDGDFVCGRLCDLVVLDTYRGRGIGAALIDAGEAYAKGEGVKHLQLGVMAGNSAAIALYEARGYKAHHLEFEKIL